MEEDLVSIIIPLYNKQKYIRKAIESVEEQTYTNWEMIIVDDCSKDDGYEICKRYIENSNKENIKLLKTQKNSGPAIARNLGLKIAKGRYICFLDADDFLKREKLEKQIKFMKNKDCAFSYCGFQYTNEEGIPKEREVKVVEMLNYKEALKNIRILTNSVMIDVEKIQKKLLIMPNVKHEDVATWWNILKEGYIAYGMQESLIYYRKTPNSLSYNKFESAIGRWRLYRDFEKLPFFKSVYYFFNYCIHAVIKRI